MSNYTNDELEADGSPDNTDKPVDGFADFIDPMGSAYARGEIGESRCEMHCGEEDCQKKNELVMMSMEL